MKRIIALVLLMCFVLVGCDNAVNENSDATAQTTVLEPTQQSTQTEGEVTTTVTGATTTQTTVDEAPTTVTVYLLDRTDLFDSGYTQYYYDENGCISHYEVMTIENQLMYTCLFEEPDENGMPCRVRNQWDEESSSSVLITYFADGKPREEQEEGTNYCGYQYTYDYAGNLSEKREYYEGMLQSLVRCEYDGDVLSGVFCENADGDALYECVVENGRVVEKIFYQYEDDSRTLYEYDEHGNLIQTEFLLSGEKVSGETYSYKTVEIEADRATYLLEQQKYLLSII